MTARHKKVSCLYLPSYRITDCINQFFSAEESGLYSNDDFLFCFGRSMVDEIFVFQFYIRRRNGFPVLQLTTLRFSVSRIMTRLPPCKEMLLWFFSASISTRSSTGESIHSARHYTLYNEDMKKFQNRVIYLARKKKKLERKTINQTLFEKANSRNVKTSSNTNIELFFRT